MQVPRAGNWGQNGKTALKSYRLIRRSHFTTHYHFGTFLLSNGMWTQLKEKHNLFSQTARSLEISANAYILTSEAGSLGLEWARHSLIFRDVALSRRCACHVNVLMLLMDRAEHTDMRYKTRIRLTLMSPSCTGYKTYLKEARFELAPPKRLVP